MNALEYSDAFLLKRIKQLKKDYARLYPNGDTNIPLYERLQYLIYLSKERGLYHD